MQLDLFRPAGLPPPPPDERCCGYRLGIVSHNPELSDEEDYYECSKCGAKYEKEITAMEAARRVMG